MASENPGFVDQYARARAGAHWRQSASGGAQDGFALIGRLAIFADQGAKVFPAPRKANALANARTAAEVLEARDMARMAYDAAKSFSRMEQAKRAHDTLIAEVYRAQANALAIEARAKMRLAEEYDAAQDRGEVAGHGGGKSNLGKPKVNDVNLRYDEIHEARQFRDAERADPGIIDRTISGMIERGEEPTKAALRREVIAKPAPRARTGRRSARAVYPALV
jgi:hypothetical protein